MKYLAILAAALALTACNTTLNWEAGANTWSRYEPAPAYPVFVPAPVYQPAPPMTICQKYGRRGYMCY
jgi:hypothetical protein